MQRHSKLPYILRKPAIGGTVFIGLLIFSIIEIIQSEQLYAHPICIVHKTDTLEKRAFHPFRSTSLFPSTAKKILIAIHKFPKYKSLRDLEFHSGLDSAIIMDALLGTLQSKKQTMYRIKLNKSDSSDWESLPGIGTKMAHRIILYRNRLGGFISKYQLLEVKYFDSNLIMSNRIEFISDPSNVKKIDLNHCDVLDFYNHPYIGKRYASILWNFKKMHSPLTESSFLEMQGIPRPEKLKIAPYFNFR